MGEQIRRESTTSEGANTDPVAMPEAVDTGVDLKDVDALLDEIDGVLETNAEDFARHYQQRGGE